MPEPKDDAAKNFLVVEDNENIRRLYKKVTVEKIIILYNKLTLITHSIKLYPNYNGEIKWDTA